MQWTLDLMQTNFHFLDVSEKVLALIRSLNDPLNARTLARFPNTWKRMNQGKTQYQALVVTSKANFTKTAIKTKFVDKSFYNFFSTLIDQCTIKSPSFELIENF